jgi:DNA-binding MarR family transcriptional regulator
VTDPATLATDLREVLGQIVRRLRAERRDLSLAQITVVGRLDRLGPMSISALAATERVRPQSMAATVASLEQEGLVSRRPDPADGRRVVLELTDSGRAAIAAERQRREGWLAQAITRELDARERELLAEATRLLARLAADEPVTPPASPSGPSALR